MTSNDAAPETPPDGAAKGLSTRRAVYGRVGGLIANRLWKETPSDIWAMSRPEARGLSTGLSLSGLSTRDRTRDPCTIRRTVRVALLP